MRHGHLLWLQTVLRTGNSRRRFNTPTPLPRRESTHFSRRFKRLKWRLGSAARQSCLQADAKDHRGGGLEVQRRGVPAMKTQRRHETFVVISDPDAAFQHLSRGEVPAGCSEHTPIFVEQNGGGQIHLLLLAERGIGRALRKL